MSTRTAKKKVLKDFGDLRPVDERLTIVATSILQIAFQGEMNQDFMPRKGTEAHRIWKMCKLDTRQQIAWQCFIDDVNLAEGKSGNVTSGYVEYTDGGNSGQFIVPAARENSHMLRLRRMEHFLSWRERSLAGALLQDTLKSGSGLSAESIGLLLSGYRDKVSARAAGVAHVQALLSRIADFYGV